MVFNLHVYYVFSQYARKGTISDLTVGYIGSGSSEWATAFSISMNSNYVGVIQPGCPKII